MIDNRDLQRLLIAVASIALIGCSIFLIISPPAVSYEFNIYNAYPRIFWFIFLSGIAALITGLLTTTTHLKSLTILLVSYYCILFLLPLYRGYWLYSPPSGDVFHHLTQIMFIGENGYIWEGNWYPTVHVLGAIINIVGLKVRSIPLVLSAVFYIQFILGLFVLSKSISGSRSATKVLACSFVLLFGSFHISFHPAVLSTMLLPVFLFSYQTRGPKESISRSICTILLGIVIVLTHPVTTIFLVGLLLIHPNSVPSLLRATPMSQQKTTIFIISIGLFSWYSAFDQLGTAIAGTTIERFGTNSGAAAGSPASKTMLDKYTDILFHQIDAPFEVLSSITRVYGPLLVFLVISGAIASRILLNSLQNRRYDQKSYLAASLLLSLVGAGVFTVFDLIVMNIIRILRFGALFSILLAGLHFAKHFKDGNGRPTFKRIFISVIIITTVVISTLAVYEPRHHRTNQEAMGTEMIIEYVPDSTTLYYKHQSPKYEKFIRENPEPTALFMPNLPDHLRENVYPKGLDLSSMDCSDPIVLATKTADIARDGSNITEHRRSNFEVLYSNVGSSKIYSNDGFVLWKIRIC